MLSIAPSRVAEPSQALLSIRDEAAQHLLAYMERASEDELIEEVRFPLRRQAAGQAFCEFGLRHGDFAICAIAVVAEGERLRVGVGGVADRPVVRQLGALANDALDDALNELAWDLDAADDAHATAAYRRGLVRRLGRQAIEEARSCRS